MATSTTGIAVPAAGDPFDPDGDMREMAASLDTRTIVPVPNEAARTALVSALVAAGRGPNGSRPLYVDRADAPAGLRLEVTYNGTTWAPYAAGDTGWVPCVNSSGFISTGLYLRKIGLVVHVRGQVTPAADGSFTSAFKSIAALPGVFRASTVTRGLHPGVSNTAYQVVYEINPGLGAIRARSVESPAAYSTNSIFAPVGWVDAD